MKGFIKITSEEFEGGDKLGVEVDLKEIGGVLGKAALLDAFLDGLNVDTDEEFKMILAVREVLHEYKEKTKGKGEVK